MKLDTSKHFNIWMCPEIHGRSLRKGERGSWWALKALMRERKQDIVHECSDQGQVLLPSTCRHWMLWHKYAGLNTELNFDLRNKIINDYIVTFLLFFLLVGLSFELRTSYLQSKTFYHLSHTSSTFYFGYFGDRSSWTMPGVILNWDPPDLNLPSGKEYKHELLVPGTFLLFQDICTERMQKQKVIILCDGAIEGHKDLMACIHVFWDEHLSHISSRLGNVTSLIPACHWPNGFQAW
jgi:hypothetical protein